MSTIVSKKSPVTMTVTVVSCLSRSLAELVTNTAVLGGGNKDSIYLNVSTLVTIVTL